MRIRRKFLQLTKWTYPYGTEHTLESYLPKGFRKDENDNYYFQIGENPTTMFACHLDTSCSKQEKVTHMQDSQYIGTNGKTILGADDKAGMVILLYMIEKKIPGLYYFFIGEEVGCIGSNALSMQWEELQMFNDIKKVISFDRRGTKSIITHQLYGRCCSDEFAQELANRLNSTDNGLEMELDDTGMMTDSAQFVDLVPECTNISVGYYNEHTVNEVQDIEFLQRLCKAVVSIDWETLPVVRDPDVDDEYDDWYGWDKSPSKYNYGNVAEEDEPEFQDGYYTYVMWGKETRRMLVSMDRIREERTLIYNWLFSTGIIHDYKGITWNGHSLYTQNSQDRLEFIGNRVDIMEYIPALATIPKNLLSDKPSRPKAMSRFPDWEDEIYN